MHMDLAPISSRRRELAQEVRGGIPSGLGRRLARPDLARARGAPALGIRWVATAGAPISHPAAAAHQWDATQRAHHRRAMSAAKGTPQPTNSTSPDARFALATT